MDFEREIEVCLRSRFTLICIETFEEERVVDHLKSVCTQRNRTLYRWDHADHFQLLTGPAGTRPTATDAASVLEAIEAMEGEVVFVLHDFHQCWDKSPKIVRKLRNLAQRLQYTRKTMIVTAPAMEIPDELKDEVVRLEYAPPGEEQLGAIIDKLASSPGVKVNLTDEGRDRILRAALGLSSSQARRIFAKAIVVNGVLDDRDLEMITMEKKEIIRESGALQFYAPSETIADVGGLQQLKTWLGMRERAFTQEAADYGLPAPKGVALIGIPGTGKSLTAKMIASLWHLPLIRLDIGALYGSYIGQSEENARRALVLAETIAPCLMWIDEIEKGLSTGTADGGTSMRVFGTILSWMQEKTKPVFIVATANDISKLPPELLRKGRFDEIFFLDLPTTIERREIFHVHIRKRKRKPEDYDLDRLSAAADGYVGAEIEQAVIEAMYIAFNDEANAGRDFTTEDILAALAKQVPMSRSQREVVGALRQWLAEGRAQSASFREVQEAQQEFVQIQPDSE